MRKSRKFKLKLNFVYALGIKTYLRAHKQTYIYIQVYMYWHKYALMWNSSQSFFHNIGLKILPFITSVASSAKK